MYYMIRWFDGTIFSIVFLLLLHDYKLQYSIRDAIPLTVCLRIALIFVHKNPQFNFFDFNSNNMNN